MLKNRVASVNKLQMNMEEAFSNNWFDKQIVRDM